MSFVISEFPDDILKGSDLRFEELAPQILEEAAPYLQNSTKNALRSSIKHSGDSELVSSLKVSRPKETKTDAFIVSVYPSGESRNTYNHGNRKYPVSNALKAIWLEYGVAGRQPARPWQDRAVAGCQAQVETLMQKKLDELTGAQ